MTSRKSVVTGAPDLVLGFAYLVAWIAPAAVGAGVISWLIVGIELEALALVGAYLVTMLQLAGLDPQAPLKVRLAALAIFAGLVGFVVYQVVGYGFWWPALILIGLLANRLGAIRRRTEDQARLELFRDALWSLGLFVLAIAPTLYLPVPSFGEALGALPAEHARWCALPTELAADFFDATPSVSWCDEPHRALAGGALYFFVSALRTLRRAREAPG